jgi:AraC-like DNA-binding protein
MKKVVTPDHQEDKKVVTLQPAEIQVTARDKIFLEKVIAIVEEKMSDTGFDIDTLAEMTGMGRTTFFKKIKGLTGLAPIEFIKEMRLQRARQYLDAGYGNKSEIAWEVGFNNVQYFSTCFKSRFQMTPSEYCKQKDKKAI